MLLTFFDLSHRTHYLNARQALRRLLDWGVVPIINENDTTATDEITFGDNDFLAAQVAILVEADKLLLLTGVDGVYTADPRSDPSAAIVREITDFATLEAQASIGDSTSALGSGGMRSKVVAAEMATAAGIPAAIVNGLRHEALGAVLAGATDEGTHFPARALGISSFKLWLRYAKPAAGTIVVDAGAARALRDGGTSLLPVGVVDVVGDFARGDAVEVQAARRPHAPGQGHRHALGRRAAPRAGPAVGAGARGVATGGGGSGASGLLRTGLRRGRSRLAPTWHGICAGSSRADADA